MTGGRLDEETTEVFAGLPDPPTGRDDPQSPLHFMQNRES